MARLTRITLTLAFFSGAAALSHELLWTRRLIDLVGATGEATSRVFGCFFLGLAIGGVVAARMVPKVKSPWLAVACCEAAIALLTVPALTLPAWSDWMWPALGPDRLVGWQGTSLKTLISVAVVLPPAIPMGMTLPFFAAALLDGRATLSRQGILLYGVNTLGGVAGLLVTSTVLLGRFGVAGSMAAAALVNLAIGAYALVLRRGENKPAEAPAPAKAAKRSRRKGERAKPAATNTPLGLRSALLLSFGSGVAMLILEILSIRLLGLVVPSSLQATVAVLAVVILLLAVAAIAFPMLLRVSPSRRAWLLLALSGAAAGSAIAPWLLYRSSGLYQVSAADFLPAALSSTALGFTLAVGVLALTTVGPALLLGGMVLPIVFAWSGSEEGDSRGQRLGLLLAANGVGGILGAELTNLAVLPLFGIYAGFAAVGALYAAAAVLVLRPWNKPTALRTAFALGVLAIPIALGSALLPKIPYLNPRAMEGTEVLDTRFGREGVLMVADSPSRGRGIVVNNQYLLGSSGSTRDERRQLLLPLLLHPNPQQVCSVGLATGISAGAALDFSPSCELTAIEISPMVTEAAALHFGDFNAGFFENPQARAVVEDGRTFITASRDQYDVIVGDLYRPYGAGEGRLFSVEHFTATRRALRDGGLFCQWLPMYQLTEEHFGIIAASFLRAYPDAELIRANHNTDNPMLGLVGLKTGWLDLAGLPARSLTLREAGSIDDAELLTPNVADRFYLGRLSAGAFGEYPVNTLGNALVEVLAGERRTVLQDPRRTASAEQDAYLEGEAWAEFERRLPKLLIAPASE